MNRRQNIISALMRDLTGSDTATKSQSVTVDTRKLRLVLDGLVTGYDNGEKAAKSIRKYKKLLRELARREQEARSFNPNTELSWSATPGAILPARPGSIYCPPGGMSVQNGQVTP